MADQANPRSGTAGQLVLDIKEHFDKNNAKAVAKDKIRNLEKLIKDWIKRGWYPEADKPVPTREDCVMLRQRSTDEMEQKKRKIDEKNFLQSKRHARDDWSDENIFRDEIMGMIMKGAIMANKRKRQNSVEKGEKTQIENDPEKRGKNMDESRETENTLYPPLPVATASAPPPYNGFSRRDLVTQAPMVVIPAQRLEIIDEEMEGVSNLVKMKTEYIADRVDRLAECTHALTKMVANTAHLVTVTGQGSELRLASDLARTHDQCVSTNGLVQGLIDNINERIEEVDSKESDTEEGMIRENRGADRAERTDPPEYATYMSSHDFVQSEGFNKSREERESGERQRKGDRQKEEVHRAVRAERVGAESSPTVRCSDRVEKVGAKSPHTLPCSNGRWGLGAKTEKTRNLERTSRGSNPKWF